MSRRAFLQASGAGLISAALSRASFADDNGPLSGYAVAETSFGRVRGIQSRGINIFKGIPYGASTDGVNRFIPPVDPADWRGVRDAMLYGHSAPQSDPPKPRSDASMSIASSVTLAAETYPLRPPSIFRALGVLGEQHTGEGEDCLVLNIWTPAINDGRKRAVMVWLHGGGFGSGLGSSPSNDGTNLALRGDVVVLTINHRLNVLGFANLSEFSSDFSASGDVSMLDIVHALEWVRTNIAQFGGDPNTVMIFGQSGGRAKVRNPAGNAVCKGIISSCYRGERCRD